MPQARWSRWLRKAPIALRFAETPPAAAGGVLRPLSSTAFRNLSQEVIFLLLVPDECGILFPEQDGPIREPLVKLSQGLHHAQKFPFLRFL